MFGKGLQNKVPARRYLGDKEQLAGGVVAALCDVTRVRLQSAVVLHLERERAKEVQRNTQKNRSIDVL